MKYSFNAFGHENILGTHQTTIEFTKDKDLSLRGTCIIGIKADFKCDELREFSRNIINIKKPMEKKSIKKKKIIIIKAGDLKEEVIADINPDFNDDKDMVIRKSNFIDKRTFAINADKSAIDLDRSFIDKLKDKNIKITIEINNL